jgi:hypothetical protein
MHAKRNSVLIDCWLLGAALVIVLVSFLLTRERPFQANWPRANRPESLSVFSRTIKLKTTTPPRQATQRQPLERGMRIPGFDPVVWSTRPPGSAGSADRFERGPGSGLNYQRPEARLR